MTNDLRLARKIVWRTLLGVAMLWPGRAICNENPKPVPALAPYQQESGLVTEKELAQSKAWFEALLTRRPGWLDEWAGTGLPFSFNLDGKAISSLLENWKFSSASKSDGLERELSWTEPDSGLQLIWQVRRFSDWPAIEWMLTFKNTGSKDTGIISEVQSLNLLLNRSRNESYTVRAAYGGRSFSDDMIPLAWQLPSPNHGMTEIELGDDFPSSNNKLPFFNIECPQERGVMVAVGWSGRWRARVQVEETDLKIQAGLSRTHFLLHPGESVRSPKMLLMFWQGEPMHAHNMWRQLLWHHYVPALPGGAQHPLVTVNVCFTYHGGGGFLHQATAETISPLVEPFAALGAELMIVDAGWYEGAPWAEWVGNWRYSKEKYPQGMRPIAQALHDKGMGFGIWFAPENVSSHAPVLAEHPEFVRPGDSGSLKMELPEVRAWFVDQVNYLIDHEGMTCYRQDGLAGLGQPAADRIGVAESEHIAGLYQMWDQLIREHPSLVREGCCGGGRRIDLETLSRFHWHQKSDSWYHSETDQCSLYGANLFLPGGVINIPTERTDDYGAWSSFAGQFCLGWHPLDASFPTNQAHRQVERYKRIRPMLSGDFYPLTPCSLADEWLGYQFHRPDLDRGFALAFRRNVQREILPPGPVFKLVLRGLNPERSYHLRFEHAAKDQTATGRALADGIDLRISQRPGAELVYIDPEASRH
jgi:alpha-galactosidase